MDRRVAPFADKLTWGRLESIVRGPSSPPTRPRPADAEVAADSVGVFRQRSTDHGIITTVLRTQAPDAIVFDASIGRVADGLGLLGDTRPQDTRRAAAVGVLANPQPPWTCTSRPPRPPAATAAADTATDGAQPRSVAADETTARTAPADCRPDARGAGADPGRRWGHRRRPPRPRPRRPAAATRRPTPAPPRPSRRRDPVQPAQPAVAGRWIRGHRSPCTCT